MAFLTLMMKPKIKPCWLQKEVPVFFSVGEHEVYLVIRVTPDIRLVSSYPACFSGIRLSGQRVSDIRPDSRILTKLKIF